MALDNFEEAERYIQENKDLDYSYYGTNEIFKLCLVYIAHKQENFELAAQYFSEFEAMPNSLNLGYLEGDFAAARSKVFFTNFSDILRKYGMSWSKLPSCGQKDAEVSHGAPPPIMIPWRHPNAILEV